MDIVVWRRRGDNRHPRCPLSERNPELFSAQWGNSTTIQTNRTSKVPLKRMAKINFHQSMCHKDRALYHAYSDIDEKGRDIPENVRARAKYIYMKFCERELTRGNVRLGIRANCLLHACSRGRATDNEGNRNLVGHRPEAHVEDGAATQRRTRGHRHAERRCVCENESKRRAPAIIHALSGRDGTRRSSAHERMCDDIAKSTAMQSRTPATAAAVVVSFNLCSKLSKLEIATRCDVSLQTLTRMEDLVKQCLRLEK